MNIMTRDAAEFWWGKVRNKLTGKAFQVPSNVSYYEKSFSDNSWKAITWENVMEKRRQKQERMLSIKRHSTATVKKAALIWVFENEGFPYGGWWIYLKTIDKDYGLNFKQYNNPKIVHKIMKMYPCGVIPLRENIEYWCEEFCRQNHTKSFNGRKKQGVMKCWALLDWRGIIDVNPISHT